MTQIDHTCKACGAALTRRAGERPSWFAKRMTCGHACARRLTKPGKGPQWIEEDRGYETPCWIWQRALNHAGYGQVRVDRVAWLAHRWTFAQRHGSVHDGPLDHLCRQPACVNPDHLEEVTTAENNRRQPSTLLTVDDVRAIKASPLGCRRLARQYGVSRHTIMALRQGRSWVDVEAAAA